MQKVKLSQIAHNVMVELTLIMSICGNLKYFGTLEVTEQRRESSGISGKKAPQAHG